MRYAGWVTANLGTNAVTVSGCLFNGNHATGGASGNNYGGAINLDDFVSGTGSAAVNIQNSTFYQNSSDNHGGAIVLYNTNSGSGTNTVNLTSLTVYQNQAATDGGGLWTNMTDPALLPTVWNSIIAGNSVNNPPTSGPDVFGNVISAGYNLIGQGGRGMISVDGNEGWIASDYVGNDAAPYNPQLDPAGLSNNGGPTKTIKVLQVLGAAWRNGDPALLNAANPLKQDQRGKTRTTFVTIGAYDPDAV